MSSHGLSDFFSNLDDRGITVSQQVDELLRPLRQVKSARRPSDMGYCYYREHDAQRAVVTGTLFLSWGCYSDDDVDLVVVANAIMDEARACGLSADWNGSVTSSNPVEESG